MVRGRAGRQVTSSTLGTRRLSLGSEKHGRPDAPSTPELLARRCRSWALRRGGARAAFSVPCRHGRPFCGVLLRPDLPVGVGDQSLDRRGRRPRRLSVDWRFICLRMVNEAKDYEPVSSPLATRTCTAPGAACCASPPRPATTAATMPSGAFTASSAPACTPRPRPGRGTRRRLLAHCRGRHGRWASAGLEGAGDDEQRDVVVRAETDLALVPPAAMSAPRSSPSIQARPRRPASSVRVLNRIPRAEEAVDLWDDVVRLARPQLRVRAEADRDGGPDFS